VKQTDCVSCEAGTTLLYVTYTNFSRCRPWHDSGLSPRSLGFDPGPVHVRYAVDRLALWQVFLPILRFSPVSIVPPMLHTRLHLNTTLIRRTSGRSLGTEIETTSNLFQQLRFFLVFLCLQSHAEIFPTAWVLCFSCSPLPSVTCWDIPHCLSAMPLVQPSAFSHTLRYSPLPECYASRAALCLQSHAEIFPTGWVLCFSCSPLH
jgi:hypothetical protein